MRRYYKLCYKENLAQFGREITRWTKEVVTFCNTCKGQVFLVCHGLIKPIKVFWQKIFRYILDMILKLLKMYLECNLFNFILYFIPSVFGDSGCLIKKFIFNHW